MSRYIDADELKELYEGCEDLKVKCAVVLLNIDDMSTADVAEVVHGEWIKADSMPRSAKCSECSCWITRHTINENWFRYCPHCGAKMDKKKVE